MIKQNELLALFESKGIALEKYKIELFDKKTEIELPFFVYSATPRNYGADGACFFQLSKIKLEVITATEADLALDKVREILVELGLFYSEETEYYDSEMVFSTIFEFTVAKDGSC